MHVHERSGAAPRTALRNWVSPTIRSATTPSAQDARKTCLRGSGGTRAEEAVPAVAAASRQRAVWRSTNDE